MDASHRAALLTASCLHTPVNPRTKAPAALYERVPERASLEDGVGQVGGCLSGCLRRPLVAAPAAAPWWLERGIERRDFCRNGFARGSNSPGALARSGHSPIRIESSVSHHVTIA